MKRSRGVKSAARRALWAGLVVLVAGAPAGALQEPPQGPPPPESPASTQPEVGPPRTPAERAAAQPAVPAGAEPVAAAPMPSIEPSYRPYADVAELVVQMVRAAPGAARALELAGGIDGQPIQAIEFGRPNGVPLEERPTVLLIGGLDGVSLAGSEGVLAIVRRLLEDPSRLPPDVAFVAIPWASPTGLSRTLDRAFATTGGERAVDEDGDGRLDEDGPDDVDGDGLVLSMLVEDPDGPWTLCSDERFLVPAGPGDAPRYRRVPEGRDDDGDGLWNEDSPGGVVLDRNFPLGRERAWRDPLCGTVPLSEPGARALADLALARRTAVVMLLQGNHGGLAAPGGAPGPGGVALPLAADRRLYARAAESFAATSGRAPAGLRRLSEARGREVPGAALDWFYAGVGALAFEIAPWGPGVGDDADVSAQDARFRAEVPRERDLGARPLPSQVDRDWAAWLDNTRGGLGFVDWHPVELGPGQQALVGGWEQYTVVNPPEEILPRALEGLPEFVAGVAAALPRLEIRLRQAQRVEEGLVHVRASVKNLGLIPTGLAGGLGPGGRGRLTLELELPPGARLIAGEERVELGRLDGGELSPETSWLVLAPQGSTLRLRAGAELTLPVEVEVQP